MKFKSIPCKKVFFNGEIVEFNHDGEYETSDKDLQKAFVNCKDVKADESEEDLAKKAEAAAKKKAAAEVKKQKKAEEEAKKSEEENQD